MRIPIYTVSTGGGALYLPSRHNKPSARACSRCSSIHRKIEVAEWTEVEKQANPARRGFIRVSQKGPRAGRYLASRLTTLRPG